jgi:hypothetical protein
MKKSFVYLYAALIAMISLTFTTAQAENLTPSGSQLVITGSYPETQNVTQNRVDCTGKKLQNPALIRVDTLQRGFQLTINQNPQNSDTQNSSVPAAVAFAAAGGNGDSSNGLLIVGLVLGIGLLALIAMWGFNHFSNTARPRAIHEFDGDEMIYGLAPNGGSVYHKSTSKRGTEKLRIIVNAPGEQTVSVMNASNGQASRAAATPAASGSSASSSTVS